MLSLIPLLHRNIPFLVFVEFFLVRTSSRTKIVAIIKAPEMIAEIIFSDFFLPPVVTLNDQISSLIVVRHSTYTTVDGLGDIGFVFFVVDIH
jgi:hypothetical protein